MDKMLNPESIKDYTRNVWLMNQKGKNSNTDCLMSICMRWLDIAEVTSKQSDTGFYHITYSDDLKIEITYAIKEMTAIPFMSIALAIWDKYLTYPRAMVELAAMFDYQNGKYAELFFSRSAIDIMTLEPLIYEDGKVRESPYYTAFNINEAVRQIRDMYKTKRHMVLAPKTKIKQVERESGIEGPSLNEIRELLEKGICNVYNGTDKLGKGVREFALNWLRTSDVTVEQLESFGECYKITDAVGTVYKTYVRDMFDVYSPDITEQVDFHVRKFVEGLKSTYFYPGMDVGNVVKVMQGCDKNAMQSVLVFLRLKVVGA